MQLETSAIGMNSKKGMKNMFLIYCYSISIARSRFSVGMLSYAIE
jgi:hypothetical protein